jgi:hypothetical protein
MTDRTKTSDQSAVPHRLDESAEIALAEKIAAACGASYGVHVSVTRIRRYLRQIEFYNGEP